MLLRSLLTFTTTTTAAARLLPTLISHSNLLKPHLVRSSYHPPSTCPMSQPTAEWLNEQMSKLLASPHIHFTQPNVPGLHMRMGPGPIDVFSTKFANMFTKDATGVLNGQEVDRDALKEGLLKLQKNYNKDTVQFSPQQPEADDQTKVSWVAACGSKQSRSD